MIKTTPFEMVFIIREAMSNETAVLEYKCPCCNAGLTFGEDEQQLTCEYCDNTFEIEAVREFNRTEDTDDTFQWEETSHDNWSEEEENALKIFTCPSCGGEILSDEHTAATFCPYCDNPAILPSRLSGGWKPDAVIPFRTSKDDAKKAFAQLCKGKPLLPKGFAADHRLEKITGMYVPFWLYDCGGKVDGRYHATRVHRWSDSRYHYTRTDHYLLTRGAKADFSYIPMDGSSKMDNAIMESIEPYDYRQMIDFDTAYLSGFLADKYDVESATGEERIRQRVGGTLDERIAASCIGYVTVIPTSKNLQVNNTKAKYVLLPVWMLHTKYKDKTYTFAMNGQTGKMTGTFPICPKRSAAWFAGICAGVTALVSLIQWLVL